MTAFNNAFIIDSIVSRSSRHRPRRRVTSDPCLLERLPPKAFIEREADTTAPFAILKQLRRSPPPTSPKDDDESHRISPRRQSTSAQSTDNDVPSSPNSAKFVTPKYAGPWKDPQPFEVFRAVERKDIEYLMQIRDRAFHLLLRKTGDATPLLHAMRIGQSHRDVAIILLGAFSRWINNLDDFELQKPKTKPLLKALRTNLKLAIDLGLAKSQSDLTAAFMQTLIMSEGDKWIYTAVASVTIALRAGTRGEPVKTADSAVRKFATRELGKAELIASLEDYVANATVDLLMMGAWNLALETIKDEPLPAYYFARDDRMYKAFQEKLGKHSEIVRQRLGRRLKWQIRVISAVVEGRTTTYRRKIELLTAELDTGDGV